MPSITHFIERLKLHKIQGFLNVNWYQLKHCLQPIDNKLDLDQIKTEDFSTGIFYKLISKDKTQWSRLTLDDRDSEFSATHLNRLIGESRDNQIRDIDIYTTEWIGNAEKYSIVTGRLLNLFDNAFSWNKQTYEWELIKECLPESNAWFRNQLLKPNLLPDFSGSIWNFYKYTDGGVERMILEIDPKPDKNGIYGAKVLGKEREGIAENVIFSGQTFTDEKYNTILLLRDDLNRYAHLILLTPELPHTQTREICIGHLSYFSRNPDVERYLTKTIILVNSMQNPQPAKRLSFEEQCSENEKMVLSFLSNKRQNRLTTPGADIFAWKGFRIWFDKQRSSNKSQSVEDKVITSYVGKYHIYYIKKHPKNRSSLDNNYEFFQDELTLTAIENSKGLHAVYTHWQSLTEEVSTGLREEIHSDYIGVRNQIHSDYTGELRIWGNFLSGQLLSELGGPLYITSTIRERGLIPVIERFVGTLVGERDSGVVTVAYTCVIVPDLIVKGFQKVDLYQSKINIIKDFLENEAKKGWGVIDPPRRNVNSFMVDDLRSEDN